MKLQSGYPFSLIRYGLPYQYPKLTSSLKTEVVIVGGGISGALAGYYLTMAGIECVIVDARTVGLGSTCASTSLLQYEIDVPLTALVKKIGDKDAVRAYQLCKQAIYKLGLIAEKIGFEDFQLNKSLYFAASKSHMDFLKEEYTIRKNNGFKVDLLAEEDTIKKFGFSSPAAILSHDGAYADAYLLTNTLHQYGIKKGLKVYDRTLIKKFQHEKNGVTLFTEDNVKIKAKKIIHATGYEVIEIVKKKIVNLHSTYVTISEHAPNPEYLLNNDVMLWNTADPYLYMRKTVDGRIIVGGRDENFSNPASRDKLIDKKSKLLVRDFNKLFPRVEFKSEFSWTGTFGSTKDGLPFIGQYSKFPNAYFALGFGGNGITFSVIAAEIIRDHLLGKKNADNKIFSFERI